MNKTCETCGWRKYNNECASVWIPDDNRQLTKNPLLYKKVPKWFTCKGWGNANVSEVQAELGQER